jgi:hypothetical protein
MTTIFIVTVFLASVIGFSLLMKHFRAKGVKTRDTPIKPPPKPAKEPPEEEIKHILNALIKANLMVRSDREFPNDLVLDIEQIIDNLKSVIPTMMENYPGETLTWELKKIGRSHLKKTIKEYLDLSPESRQEQLETFKSAIQQLRDVAVKSRQLAETNETQEFKTMASFLGQKFS